MYSITWEFCWNGKVSVRNAHITTWSELRNSIQEIVCSALAPKKNVTTLDCCGLGTNAIADLLMSCLPNETVVEKPATLNTICDEFGDEVKRFIEAGKFHLPVRVQPYD